jgi:hypothetical protein
VILPYEISFGSFVRFQSGEPFARQIETARSLNQGYETVRVEEPGSQRYPNVFTVDLRVGKIFELPLGNLEAMFDVFNLTNGNVITDQGTIIGDTLGTVEEILPPRIARIGVKWTF